MFKRRIIADKYEIWVPSGRGGHSRVFSGRSLVSGEKIALKILRNERAVESRNAERFRKEAVLANSLCHPNICPVLEYGIAADGEAFIAMPLLVGRTFSRMIEGRALPSERAAKIVSQVLLGLEAAHDVGIVHRDVKPSNVMVLYGDTAVLLDFGAAQLEGDPGARLTRTGGVIGTAVYMSPEQASGVRVDYRTDIYSAGVMLYEALTGRRPLDRATTSEIIDAIVGARVFPSPRLIEPSIPMSVEAVVLRAMARDPYQRFCSARQMRAELLAAVKVASSVQALGKSDIHFDQTKDLPLAPDLCRGER